MQDGGTPGAPDDRLPLVGTGADVGTGHPSRERRRATALSREPQTGAAVLSGRPGRGCGTGQPGGNVPSSDTL
ncbi:MAG: hypothetical protein JWQ37_904 [Blastococcus sp.]|nr:hypothetical protein [Blastococcus sp.]